MTATTLTINNATAAPLQEVPSLPVNDFRDTLQELVQQQEHRVSAFFGLPASPAGRGLELVAVLSHPEAGKCELVRTAVQDSFPSLTPDCPAFHWFERELAEQYCLEIPGHPWLKPIRFQPPLPGACSRKTATAPNLTVGDTNYFTLAGEACHEVAVGPVHAGVIEPGHFRFQCLGEDVYSLEISLGYQHRGLEKMLPGGPDRRTLPLIATASGDSSIASTTAYAQLCESLDPGLQPESGALLLRGIAAELERLANHVGDLGALAGDVAFLTTAAFCGRLRGEFLNMTAEICGNRFGRNLVCPGGVNMTFTPAQAGKILAWLQRVLPEVENALELMFESATVLDRFEGTGTVSKAAALELGLVGPAARACGVALDLRHSHPYGCYKVSAPALAAGTSGDVLARAWLRRQEIAASAAWLQKQLAGWQKENCRHRGTPRLAPGMIAVSMVEAWRGEMCHVAVTAADGTFRRYKIVDPSFHNWFGLAMAMRGEQISHFPICNKSFNLSYCGHDL
ncbi:MAG: hydrogenase [Oligosphaeraceae bacterium]|nr:hydrogenase [Oligosphaeraceae bacterium]